MTFRPHRPLVLISGVKPNKTKMFSYSYNGFLSINLFRSKKHLIALIMKGIRGDFLILFI